MVNKSNIAALLGVVWSGVDGEVKRVSSLDEAGPDAVVFASDEKTLAAALATGAGLILARSGTDEQSDRVLVVQDPRLAFAQVYAKWFDRRGRAGVHQTAQVDQGAVVGLGSEIGPLVYIGNKVRLGADCVIGPRVVILPGTTLGDRVKVQAGAVLGSDGFGYVRGPEGYLGFPQIGTLFIEDDVEIGANTTIDRGALGETRIGRGTKIDNLVHIGHNCKIGKDVIMASQVGIAGSTEVCDGAMLGGQAGLGEHVVIGKGVILGGQGGVLPGKTLNGEGEVFWGTPARPIKLYLRDLARLRRSK